MAEAATQKFLDIEKIKEGVIISKNKSLVGVLMVSSLNFALKSDDEQSAITYQFQNFLNSLDFSIEIIIQSRRLNITGYLEKLKELEDAQENELLKIQTAGYQSFIRELITGSSIMSKSFFVAVPFPQLNIPGANRGQEAEESQFQRAKSQLWQRLEFVALGLRRCGLQCSPLSTAELIELFWSAYHPQEAEVGYYPEIPPELIT
ncbi:MAG: hypothetical protein Q7K28_00645 [Candidatus Wildermuthbacteria bacterium]|nr:hypothetical protein [Candidatus Wildermuthbacteria bacterium]